MATPYGHTLAGLSLFNLWYPRADFSDKKGVLVYGLVILGASFPDLDFIPGLILGQAGRFHHGYFHSLGVAILVSLSVGIFIKIFQPQGPSLKTGVLVLSLILSHLFLDYFTEAPKGFPLFWPFSEARILSPLPVLPRVERTFGHPEIWSQGLLCFFVETILLLPFWLISLRRRPLHK
jgi:membrane-bound metal-dependent hydrolase YbcI (DUF457 family)